MDKRGQHAPEKAKPTCIFEANMYMLEANMYVRCWKPTCMFDVGSQHVCSMLEANMYVRCWLRCSKPTCMFEANMFTSKPICSKNSASVRDRFGECTVYQSETVVGKRLEKLANDLQEMTRLHAHACVHTHAQAREAGIGLRFRIAEAKGGEDRRRQGLCGARVNTITHAQAGEASIAADKTSAHRHAARNARMRKHAGTGCNRVWRQARAGRGDARTHGAIGRKL